MNKENQILLIKKFLLSNEETIIINQVNDDIGIFYLILIKYYADKQNITINSNEIDTASGTVNDLFGDKEIKLFSITNVKKLAEALNTHDKKIIFTDYKNFKKLNSKHNCINGYKFEQDLNFFIRDELNINNDELIHFSKYDCDRSIPNMVDGLKVSQRKIIYSAFKKKFRSSRAARFRKKIIALGIACFRPNDH